MKKKYIQYRSGLLIGLLSLNTLSSCVHTSRELGMDNKSSRDMEAGRNRNNQNRYEGLKSTAKVAAGMAIGFTAKAAWDYCTSASTRCDCACPNATSTTPNPWNINDPNR